MRSVHIGMWSFDTVSNQNLGTRLRLTMLESELLKFERFCLDIENTLETEARDISRKRKILGIFIAPENLFCHALDSPEPRAHDYGDKRQLSERERDIILHHLRKMSRAYPRMLLIPGSISWKKSIERPTGSDRKWWHQVASPNPFAALADPVPSRREKSLARLLKNAKLLGIKGDEAVSAPLGFINENTPARTVEQKVTSLEDATHIAKNTSYVLLGGIVQLKYNKASDFHEVLDNSSTVFIPGVLLARLECDGLSLALDLCLDNNYATLQAKGPAVDIHILMSAATEGEDTHANLKEGGWFVHCSSNRMYCGLKQKGFGSLASESIHKLGDLRCSSILILESAQEVEQVRALMQQLELQKYMNIWD